MFLSALRNIRDKLEIIGLPEKYAKCAYYRQKIAIIINN